MKNICIILVGPQGDGNIGACARAMKNFGVTDLRLVQPVPYKTKDAFMWAVDAKDILENAREFDSLEDALADVTTSAAFTRRLGRGRKGHMTVRNAAEKISREPNVKTALYFGREDAGLTNEEIALADFVVSIPSSSKLPSLNLAQSVLIACHELFSSANESAENSMKTSAAARTARNNTVEFVHKSEINKVLKNLDITLAALDYEDKGRATLKTKMLNQFDRLFGRAGLGIRDVNMFCGLLARIRKLAQMKVEVK